MAPFPLRSLLLALVVVAWPAAASEPPRSGQPVFDRAVRLVVDHFHDEKALDRFAQAVRDEIQDPSAPLDAKSPPARVDRAIDAVLASLGASHTGRFKPGTIDYYELADVFRFGIRDDLKPAVPARGRGELCRHRHGGAGKATGCGSSPTSMTDRRPTGRGSRSATRSLSVDGAPYREIDFFAGKAGKKVDVAIRRRPDAAPIKIAVDVERLKPLPMFEKAIADSAEVVEHDGRKIGYIRLWTLAARNSMGAVAEALAEGRLKDVDGLVLDLRGRWGGGSSDAAELFVGDTPPFRLVDRDGEAYLANVRWKKPLVAIIDEGSRSGLEVFAYALKVNDIPLVGARTAGALLAGRAYLLPDDSLLEIAVSDAVIGDDIRLEGSGVPPDIPVPFSLPYAAGKDPQRDAAIDEMRRILGRG